MSSEVVVSGVGVISALGTEKRRFFEAFGPSGPSPEEEAEIGEVEPGTLTRFLGIQDPKLKIARYLDPTAKNLVVAVGNAMADAGIEDEDVASDPYGYALVLGAVRGPTATRSKAYEMLRKKGGKMLSGTLFSNLGYNIAGAMAAIAHGIKGPNLTLSANGGLAVSLLRRSRQLLLRGRAHTVFCGYTESGGSASGRGALLPESACVFCLELEDHARGRGRRGLIRFDASEGTASARGEGDVEAAPVRDTLGLGEDFMPFVRLGMGLVALEDPEGAPLSMSVSSRAGPARFTLTPTP